MACWLGVLLTVEVEVLDGWLCVTADVVPRPAPALDVEVVAVVVPRPVVDVEVVAVVGGVETVNTQPPSNWNKSEGAVKFTR